MTSATWKGRIVRDGLSTRFLMELVAAAIAVVTIISQSPEFGGGRISYHGGSPVFTFLTMLTVLPRYLRLLFYRDRP